jgi:hypothetical protein
MRSITAVVWLESDSTKKKTGAVCSPLDAYACLRRQRCCGVRVAGHAGGGRRTMASASLDNSLRYVLAALCPRFRCDMDADATCALLLSCRHSCRVWEEKFRIKGGRGTAVGVSETRYEPIWTRDILQSPAMCLTHCADTSQLIVGHYDGEIQVCGASSTGSRCRANTVIELCCPLSATDLGCPRAKSGSGSVVALRSAQVHAGACCASQFRRHCHRHRGRRQHRQAVEARRIWRSQLVEGAYDGCRAFHLSMCVIL